MKKRLVAILLTAAMEKARILPLLPAAEIPRTPPPAPGAVRQTGIW